MAGKVADRPHAITIALALLAAGIAAMGVYISHKKTETHSGLREKPELQQQSKAPTVIPTPATPKETELEAAQRAIVGVWKCGPDTFDLKPDGTAVNDGFATWRYTFVDSTHVAFAGPWFLARSITWEAYIKGSTQFWKDNHGLLWHR
jgi:hypothetical protein